MVSSGHIGAQSGLGSQESSQGVVQNSQQSDHEVVQSCPSVAQSGLQSYGSVVQSGPSGPSGQEKLRFLLLRERRILLPTDLRGLKCRLCKVS